MPAQTPAQTLAPARVAVRHGHVPAVIEVVGPTVQVHVEGTVADVASARLLQVLGGIRPPWLSAAAAVQAALDAAPGADPATVLGLLRATAADKRSLIDSRGASTAQWVALAHDRERAIRSRAARAAAYPSLPEAALLALLADPEREVRRQAVIASRHRPDLLAARADDPDLRVRLAVARHAQTPVATLGVLAADPQPGVRIAVAARKSLPVALLRALAADPEVVVRGQVAQHVRLPQDLLRTLAADRRADVRGRVTSRRSLPVDVLLDLARDRSAAVQHDLIARHTTYPLPRPVLAALAESEHRPVRWRMQALADRGPR